MFKVDKAVEKDKKYLQEWMIKTNERIARLEEELQKGDEMNIKQNKIEMFKIMDELIEKGVGTNLKQALKQKG